jgi:hypothetical protein
LVSICFEIKTECKHCGGTLELNAFVNKMLCPACQKMNEFPYGFWKKSIIESALNDYSDLHEGEGQNQTVMTGEYTFHSMYGIQKPRCGKCKTSLDSSKFDEYAKSGIAVCEKCKNEISVRSMPQNLQNDFGNIKYLIGEDRDMFTEGKGTMKTPKAVKPILFSCPSCGGNLKIDGSDRVVTCTYCNQDIYLPDDLWFRLHPVKVVQRWYMVLDEKKVEDKPVEWYYLSDVITDKDGNLYLATADDDEHFMLWSMAPDFKTRWKVPGLEYSHEDTRLAVSQDGKLYMWDKNKHSLLILSTKNGSTIKKIDGRQATAQEPVPFNLKEADSLTVDKDGSLLVLKNKYILRFSADSKRIATWSGIEEKVVKEKKGFFSKLFGSVEPEKPEEEEDRYPPDVDEMKNRPLKLDTEYTFVTLGWDGFIYFMESTSSSDASVAKYNRNGKKLWYSIVPLAYKDSRPCIDKNGFVYVLGKKDNKYYLVRLNPAAMKWETLLKDINEGGNLNEVENLAVSPDGSRIYCLEYNNRMRVFDASMNMVYISEQSKQDDDELAAEHKKKVENDEEFK